MNRDVPRLRRGSICLSAAPGFIDESLPRKRDQDDGVNSG